MRLIFTFFCLLILINCKKEATKNHSLTVILAYLDSNVSQKKFDIRIYNPLPPPELKDSINNGGRIKNDSVINSLEPLLIFINDSILYSSNFKLKKESIVDFIFIKERSKSKKQSVFLNINSLKERKGILLKSIKQDEFEKKHPDIYLDDNYGGLLSFQNLFISENGKKAYFEVNYFKEKLNSSTYAVYAEFKNEQWVFKPEMISIS